MVKLSDAFDLQMGKTPARANDAYWNDGSNQWVSIADLSRFGKYVDDTKETITDLAVSESGIKVVPADTVIMSFKLSIGKTAIAKNPVYTNEAIMAFIPNGKYEIDTNYLYHMLSSRDWSKGTNRAVMGATLNKATLGEIEIHIPPIAEQLEIAEILDKVDELIANRNGQLDHLDMLVKSRFIELFHDKNFPVFKWNDVFNTTTGKLDANAMVADGAYPFFTCAKEVYRIDKYAFDQEALLLAGNNAAGKYDVKYYKGKFNAYQRTYVLSLKQAWSYQLFRYQLEDKLTYLQEQSKGSNTRYITLKILSDLEFVVPPMDLQNEFAAFVEHTDKLKLAVTEALAELETLKKSLMQQYFG